MNILMRVHVLVWFVLVASIYINIYLTNAVDDWKLGCNLIPRQSLLLKFQLNSVDIAIELYKKDTHTHIDVACTLFEIRFEKKITKKISTIMFIIEWIRLLPQVEMNPEYLNPKKKTQQNFQRPYFIRFSSHIIFRFFSLMQKMTKKWLNLDWVGNENMFYCFESSKNLIINSFFMVIFGALLIT